ncbi:lincosamide and streptogramin A transport system ATP-binding/permease protein [Weissella uvarum]|uniref:ribosomal protection-like ABC-F family protein n=1 Tax=Weissella uvarum TaxID=1479233 RepID=UPI0019605CE3|nr:ABC-F type ribosomal protection protein [Weissella uvarum]MBM7616991.1 lincosamide and streptogramin A transport system ATP-binding/permease protein [Weissella uvarum]MCM0595291.1 ABC-F type ribosomal protection protein [Weissella uvarum]
MSKITIKNMTFAYAGNEPLFEDVNLNLDTSWQLGLVGRNGRGKTTLLNIIQGKLKPAGEVDVPVAINYFPQDVHDEQMLVDYVIDDLCPIGGERWQVDREMSLLGLPDDILYRPFATLSGGEQTKVLLALCFADSNGYVLLDEPTNHLDQATRKQVEGYLKQKAGYLVVSHDRQFLNAVTNHIMAIEKTNLVLYGGNFAVYEQEKAARDQYELEKHEHLQKDIQVLKRTARQKADWSRQREASINGNPREQGSGNHGDRGFETARAARMMKKSKQIERRRDQEITEKQSLLHDLERQEPLMMNVQSTHQKELVQVKDLTLNYGAGNLFAPISFQIKPGEVVALTGENGLGKSSLLKAVLGQFTGQITGDVVCQAHQISTMRQEPNDLNGSLTEFCELNRLDQALFLNVLHKLGVDRKNFATRIEAMSQGERKRVELARALVTPAELYIWDEPLNYLDVFNQGQLEQVILKMQPTMLIVEHDQTFIENIKAKKINLQKN